MSKKLWGGVFSEATDPRVEAFSRSLSYDQIIAPYDITASIAHVKMLSKCGYLKVAEKNKLVAGLKKLLADLDKGTLQLDPSAEDIHTAIECLLKKRVGMVADKLHTARSRNDQVLVDMKLFCKDQIAALIDATRAVQKALVASAKKYQDVIVPGYTHLRRAQPVLWAQHVLAYCAMFERDVERLQDVFKRCDELPLGACALSGTTLTTDRAYLAKLLGFSRVSANSMDTVSDRDFIIELLSVCSLIGMHLSRMSEEFILWSTDEFGFVTIHQSFCTGSSIMPQKINPDVLELIRGQAGAVYGDLINVLVMMKGLPLSYNRDMQHDKLPLFNTLDISLQALELMADIVGTMTVNKERIQQAVADESLLATDIAEYLVEKGVPFRKAHQIVGNIVKCANDLGENISALPLSKLKKFSSAIDGDFMRLFDVKRSVSAKRSLGGTGLSEVKKQLQKWQKILTKKR